MVDYSKIISACEESKHLISMVSIERIVSLGYRIGLDKNKSVLDFCCGYGTMLKIWNEAFDISGVGIDRDASFIKTGSARLINDCIKLITGDVLAYDNEEKYDVVVCTELSTGLFNNFSEGIAFLERFVKPGGTLIFGRLFSKIPNPPQELIDFDGELPTLREIYDEVKQCGYLIMTMASDNTDAWEQYIFNGTKQAIKKLRQNPKDVEWAAWNDKWFHIYFDYRRPYEGWALFAIEKI